MFKRSILFLIIFLLIFISCSETINSPLETENTSSESTNNSQEQKTKITITFDSQGGSTIESKEVTVNQTYGTLQTPTKEDYNFIGWSNEIYGSTIITDETIISISVDHTLYALWEPINYLCFKASGSSSIRLRKTGYTETAATFEYKVEDSQWCDLLQNGGVLLADGEKVYIRTKEITPKSLYNSGNRTYFEMTGKIYASGSIMSLIDKNCSDTAEIPAACFANLGGHFILSKKF